ncbi:MAG TPA: MBL fold metallo-hydrolase [Rhodopila sp.]|uniref:MBL fold metallo-hydrolase n=1 Tax=Rhodopila sp. TaxID=2480087 RepID=UPI002CAD93A9|nr:MBL fold metallo-hydrolase [Rhodopila sp.]HVY15614.1 MBL fold metallo-hydrolase [Rhodopila sp.]
MPAFICTTCGCQYPATEAPPAGCLICQDTRQYVNPAGQAWTTLPAMRRSYFNAFRQIEPGLTGIGTFPSFAIGQRALLLRTAAGNVLWDCISFLDDATIAIVSALGGLAGIALSHPHFFATAVEWSRAFGNCPIHVHALDRDYVTRQDPAVNFWDGDTLELSPGVTVIRCGGHFPGSSVLHWAAGAQGKGALLTGDTLQVRPDKGLTFMHSYPNLIPLPAPPVQRIADTLAPWSFETIYGGWWERVIPANAKQVMARSVTQYIAAVTGG